jgi:hypothetical protein
LPSRSRRRIAVAVVCLVLAAPGWAAAAADVRTAPAAVVDTIADPTSPVTDTVKDTVEPILDTTRPATDAVNEVARPVTDRLPPPPDPVREVIDDNALLNDGSPAGDRVNEVVAPRTAGNRSRPVTSNPRGAPSTGERRGATREQRPDLATALTGVSLTPTPPIARASDGTSLAEIIQGLGQASRQFSFPLTIAALVLLFLGVQGRLDARDPKLAARGEDEELLFA